MKTTMVISLILVLLPLTGQAAELFFEPRAQETGVGQEFQVDLMLDPQGKEINAVSASIVFPQDLLEVLSIRDGSSILTLWVERPTVKDGAISFSGVAPGGFIGIMRPENVIEPGKVLGVVFKTRGTDAKPNAELTQSGLVGIQNPVVLLHDGLGTRAELEISNFEFLISKQIPFSEIPIIETDTTPPEPFTPEVGSSPNLFDGKWFLVFATQDKESGIDHYEIRESRRKTKRETGAKWLGAESPYLLKDQKLKSYVYVKALDRAGNERIAIIEPRYPLRWYENYLVWLIILLGTAVIYVVRRFLWKKKF